MQIDTLRLLRCPYCGGHLTLRRTAAVRDDDILAGVVACHCSRFPIVGGIAVMSVEGMADTAREHLEAGDADLAVRTMFAGGDEDLGRRYDGLARGSARTYKETLDVLEPGLAEAGYFLYRFSDPTFLVADALVRAVSAVALRENGRAIDVCGGSGHLTRTLRAVTPLPPVLMDWSFAKLWLATRFIEPGTQAICADAHTALPFAAGAFRLAVCSDAFHYIWSKALLAHEMERIVDREGVVALTHAHNILQPNASAGMALPPAAYAELFESLNARLYPESALLEDVLAGQLDLQRLASNVALRAEPALTLVATARRDLFRQHRLEAARAIRGELRINPLYGVTPQNGGAELALCFPSEEYEREFGHCRSYLPERVTLPAETLAAITRGASVPAVSDLRLKRILLDLPKHFC